MASIITEGINVGAFELIRDRIGLILSEELPNQATLKSDTDLNIQKIWVERFVPFSHTECPAINVSLSDGNYEDKSRLNQHGKYQFFIDIIDKAKTTDENLGGQLASVKVQKITNVCRGILAHHSYNTLAFAPPFIEHTKVESIKVGNPGNDKESVNMVMARITFTVDAPENFAPFIPSNIDGYVTKAVLGLTDKGYLYGGDAYDPPVTPICAPVTITRDSVFYQFVDSGGTFNFETACEPAIIEINSTLLGPFVSGSTSNIIVEHVDGSPVPTTLVGGKIIVPNVIICPSTRIYKDVTYTGMASSYADGDAYYRKVNGLINTPQSTSGVEVRLQPGSQTLLIANNKFLNLFRITGTDGGYYNHSTGLYYNNSNIETTRELAFPDGLGVDHLTNRLVQVTQSGSKSWYSWCSDGLILTIGDFTGFYLPLITEGIEYGNYGLATPQFPYRDNDPFEFNGGLKVLSETYLGSGSSSCYDLEAYGHTRSTPKANSNRAFLVKPIDIEATF